MRQVNGNYLTRVVSDPSEIASTDWDGLLGACEAGAHEAAEVVEDLSSVR